MGAWKDLIADPDFRASDWWRGATTEKLDWDDPDYDKTAGVLIFKSAKAQTSSEHLCMVDVLARTNDGREIVLERIEEGKLVSALLGIRKDKGAPSYQLGVPNYSVDIEDDQEGIPMVRTEFDGRETWVELISMALDGKTISRDEHGSLVAR